MQKNKKGNFDLLQGTFISFVIIGVIAVVGLQVLGDVKSDTVTGAANCNSTAVTACGADYNASVLAISGMSNLSGKLPIIATVIGLVVLLVFIFLIAKRT